MAKFYGLIGFAVQEETEPGIWTDRITERSYTGDVLSNYRRYDRDSESINDDFSLSNRFSIVSDAYLYEHIPAIRYIKYLGTPFRVTSIEINRPRLLFNVGGVYAI